ncbi:DUF2304 domain-containing protein [Agromyces larvae]|uniref:DUF2304 domain-containing protein n=1 Tax=Agromyces larvae TaxID=2929802 RepID=A0ABY4BZ30_9MICO|nr:DUF2304 domain-containing protein [Agromyces larvae]UOE44496.1 DUF2304 domain-containing protein [Agromyces larvae]
MGDQFFIKLLLIGVLAAFAAIVLIPGRGTRKLAIKRIALLMLFLAAVVAVLFPQLINGLANLVGVGRGTDLLLYGLIIVFVGHTISTSLRFRQQEREITQLARSVALANASRPWEETPAEEHSDS